MLQILNSKRMGNHVIDDDDEVRSIVCLKNKEDMAKFEEEEDCFILEFDPFEKEIIRFSTLSLVSAEEDDSDLVVVAEKGKVACRDYPHPRHLCAKYPFKETSDDQHCDQCYCIICNTPAPCKLWNAPYYKHCTATDRRDPYFKITTHTSVEGGKQDSNVLGSRVPNSV